MKVICAGSPKTGTKTMNAALNELGYLVYDYMENYEFLGKEWHKIVTEGGTKEDFRKMFENVDAVMDIPCCHYWEQIHEAFPDAKIIFTVRENEDDWYRSFHNQVAQNSSIVVKLLGILSPTVRIMNAFGQDVAGAILGPIWRSHMFGPDTINELGVRMWYRKHNSYVLNRAPKDKLLVYNVKEGWGPLCNFLNLPIPDKEFPHKNKKGEIVKEIMTTHPLLIRAQREALISMSLIVLLFGYASYNIATKPRSDSILGFVAKLFDKGLSYFGYQKIV